VRDLGRQLGKEINLVIEGEATELDKTIVEQIGDPLVHLVRNSCDHGVEMPDDRQKSGKPRAGTVRLSAVQEGNSIVIIIEDDGKGMDPERIRVKAIEKGLIAADAKLSQREIFNLIFEPGFSTAEKVTTVSGRGVGMDVVRKQITKLKGLIDIDSAVGKGSKITIRLPLTLAIVQNLLVNVSGETLAIPLSGVVESIRVSRKEIQHVGEAEVIKLRDRVLPLIHLDEVLNIEERDEKYWYDPPGVARKATASSHNDRLFVVVVGSAEWRIGLVVDQLISQQEMVIKGLGPLLKGHPCMAGGAVLGNGQVVLVVDIADLETLHRTRARQSLEGESAL
jgi:two-component system chemotaxis sensor kinase CheA